MGSQKSVVVVKSIKRNPFNLETKPFVCHVERWTVKDSDGTTREKFFKDDYGQPMVLRVSEIGIEWSKEDPNHVHNISLLRAIMEQNPDDFKNYIQMIDLDSRAELDSEQKEKSAELVIKLKDAKTTGNKDLLYGAARFFISDASSKTVSVIYDFLLEKALKTPDELMAVLDDSDFEMKVNISKLIEAKVIEVLPDGIHKYNNSILAGSFDGIVLYMKENADFYNGLLYKIKAHKPLGIETRVEPVVQKEEPAISAPSKEHALLGNQNANESVNSRDSKEVMNAAIDAGVIKKEGGSFMYGTMKIGTNKVEVVNFLDKNSSFKNNIESLLLQVNSDEFD